MSKSACWAIVPAGGGGSRFSDKQDKLLVSLAGKPVLLRTVSALLACPGIDGVVIAASESNLSRYQALLNPHFSPQKLIFTVGGPSRRASVWQGLLALPAGVRTVVVHDAARPLIQSALIGQALQAVAQGAKGSVVAIPVVDTIKQIDPHTGTIHQTLDRTTLWRAQTPQVFEFSALQSAHQQVPQATPVTDDAQLLELAGIGPIQIIQGAESNLKITTQEDIPLAESFLRQAESGVGLFTQP
ncbi:2-C-methyl-D-erythritol 4-phosphate cytidylyltransferase [Vampirovibrio sp.]|uniref:2-C-methyl-D-erythritol 4-phosphate cytidylyltransferase n=1 Tax=Vampirovibrio sp. TaxID=2717857 RepID=UPI003593430F